MDESLVMFGFRQIRQSFCDLGIIGPLFVEVRVSWKMVDQVEKSTELPLAPQLTKIDANEGQVRLYRIAESINQRS